MSHDSLTRSAFQANLDQTKLKNVVIPPQHKSFAHLTINHWKLNNRAEEFIYEYNHPYKNYGYLVDLLKNISIGDFWFYRGLGNNGEACIQILEFYKMLFNEVGKDEFIDQLITNLLQFTEQLSEETGQQSIEKAHDLIKNQINLHEFAFIKNSNYLRSYLMSVSKTKYYSDEVLKINKNVLHSNLKFWKNTIQIRDWYTKNKYLFNHDYEHVINKVDELFLDIEKHIDISNSIDDISKACYYNDFANYFRSLTNEFVEEYEKTYYLFYLFNLRGLLHLRMHLLYDLNRMLRTVFSKIDKDERITFVENIFRLFNDLREIQTSCILDCMLTLGKGIIDSKDTNMVEFYVSKLIDFGFVTPSNIGVNETWTLKRDENHIKNIRVWLELIEYSPVVLKSLLSALVANLLVGGIFISDTDLFQRDISRFLNNDIRSVYKQMKQLTRIFPVFFNEIGAEGKLREVSTRIDEVNSRNDRLIHFLRKQVHMDSNNTNQVLIKYILKYWYDGKKENLHSMIPQDVYDSLDETGELYIQSNKAVVKLCDQFSVEPLELMEFDLSTVKQGIAELENGSGDTNRLVMLIELHKLLKEKYTFSQVNIFSYLKNSNHFEIEDIDKIEQGIIRENYEDALKQVFKLMNLCKDTISSLDKTDAVENIYYKRHLAIGIPSMYGEYSEPKFEALGMTFRLEILAQSIMSDLVNTLNLDYISAQTLRQVTRILMLFQEALLLDGIDNQGLEYNIQMLMYSQTSGSFSFQQYIDIFMFMAQNIKVIINEYFVSVYDEPLKVIIPKIHQGSDTQETKEERVFSQSEVFYRDILSSAFMVQDLDQFLSKILITLRNMNDNYTPEMIQRIMTFDSSLMMTPLYEKDKKLDNPTFIGAKAFFLKKLSEFSVQIPKGFVLTTEFYRHSNLIKTHQEISKEFDQSIKRELLKLEHETGLKYGDTHRPLLLSVRSGAAFSMPGAMDTILNIGLNDEIVEGLCQNPDSAWGGLDSYRRLLQSWGMSRGIVRDVFDDVISSYKDKHSINQKKDFTVEQMKEIVESYKEVLKEKGIEFIQDPYLQLKETLFYVLDSWNSELAYEYRNYLNIADEWGTAVIVQKIVHGNLSERSGSGVLFTHDYKQLKSGIHLNGDFTIQSQGEDIVSGLVNTSPISEYQRKTMDVSHKVSLEEDFPEIYQELFDISSKLINRYGFTHQEVEFTFEADKKEDLYILQVRNQRLSAKYHTFVFSTHHHEMDVAGRGIGIGSEAMNGRVAFNMNDIVTLKETYIDDKIILIRPDTVPEDIGMIFKSDGLITGKGGITSHAAVTADRIGKIGIVNCTDLYVDDTNNFCRINDHTFKSGDKIAIDSTLGGIYNGHYPLQKVTQKREV